MERPEGVNGCCRIPAGASVPAAGSVQGQVAPGRRRSGRWGTVLARFSSLEQNA